MNITNKRMGCVFLTTGEFHIQMTTSANLNALLALGRKKKCLLVPAVGSASCLGYWGWMENSPVECVLYIRSFRMFIHGLFFCWFPSEECGCTGEGTAPGNKSCDILTGQCHCANEGIIGRTCDQCAKGTTGKQNSHKINRFLSKYLHSRSNRL